MVITTSAAAIRAVLRPNNCPVSCSPSAAVDHCFAVNLLTDAAPDVVAADAAKWLLLLLKVSAAVAAAAIVTAAAVAAAVVAAGTVAAATVAAAVAIVAAAIFAAATVAAATDFTLVSLALQAPASLNVHAT